MAFPKGKAIFVYQGVVFVEENCLSLEKARPP